jgi:hypothetical protein
MTIREIREHVAAEFGKLADRFRFVELDLSTALSSAPPKIGRGVYVFWTKTEVVRVGKSSSRDVCQRAIEHIHDDTGRTMAALRDDPSAKILFFVADPQVEHWILALETYLDKVLAPRHPAKRRP